MEAFASGMVFTTQLTGKLHVAVEGWRSMTFTIHAWKAIGTL